jgi:putative addiction module component (TIGR02574 family)
MTTIDIFAMPVSERLMLMETLWNSLCEKSGDAMTMPAWHGQILDERMRRLDNGDETVSSWQEAKERIRAKTQSS